MEDLERWLEGVGLQPLAQALRAHDVDLDILPDLTEADLEKIGLSLGQRKRLLKAVADGRASASEPVAAPAPAVLRQQPAAPMPGQPPATAGVAAAAPPAAAVAAPRSAERRQLAVAFCDLVGSTALSSRLDPEELREILRGYREAIAAAVRRYGGHVAQFLGDGVLAYFGWPVAYEHDAEHAVRAGLAAIEAVRALPPVHGVPITVRIGIATGLVVVGDISSQEDAVVGETPNLAARLQSLAAPGSIVIETGTRRLLGGLFELQTMAPVEVKGLAQAVQPFTVLGASRVESRFDAFHGNELTALVGRDDEMQQLLRRWERAKSGAGQIVVLSGEAGIGKSRLVAALREAIAAEPHEELRYFCSPHHRDSALHPIVTQIERAAALDRDDDAASKLDRLEQFFEEGAHAAADRRLIAELLRLPGLDRYPKVAMSPLQRKQKTFEALLRQLQRVAARGPVLVAFEDAHWIDPTSQEALDRTVELVRSLPMLLIVTCRPEYVAPWTGQPNVTVMSLARLDRRDGITLIRQLLGKSRLASDLVMGIAERTDGVPLFVEELTKAILEAGGTEAAAASTRHDQAPVNAVPAVLYASLMARLDRLGPAKEVAQIAAVIGRECPHELLAPMSGLDEPALTDALSRLTAAGLLIARGTPPEATYVFKHALVQDAAYGTLLISRRQQWHLKLAELIEARFPELAQRSPELPARHYTEARQAQRAAPYWTAAGLHAAERSANVEAIRQLGLALEGIRLLPEGEARDRQELAAQSALGTSLISVHGYAAPETGAAYTRARQLSQRLGDRRGIYATLGGEFSYYFVRADPVMMRQLTHEAKSIADALSDDSLRQVERRLIGLSGMHFGEFAGARAALEAIVDSYVVERHRPPPVHYVHDPKIYALGYLGVITWIQGYPEQALRWSEAAMAYAAELNNANMTAFAHIYAGAGVYELRRDREGLRPHVAAIREITEQHSLHYFRLSGLMLEGWLRAMDGDPAQGITLMVRSVEERAALAVGWYQVRYLCMLAEVCIEQGDLGAAADFLERAQRHMADHDEHMWEAEVLRLSSELQHLQGAQAEVTDALTERAMRVARAQGARAFELRAATSLAQRWQARGRGAQARALLQPLYDAYTEGHNSADLRNAAMLLSTLPQAA